MADVVVSPPGRWTRFWHEPVRAERLALMRICVGISLFFDQLIQYLPHFADFFGPHGVAPAGYYDANTANNGGWTIIFFRTDNLSILYPIFFGWMLATLAFALGWRTRTMSVVVWFLTLCFLNRNTKILIGADALLQVALFLLMLSPCGKALSLDARRLRKKGYLQGAAYVPPWSLRLIQLQLCMMYLSTGLVKLKGATWSWDLLFQGRFSDALQGGWWDGTAIHHVLNYVDMSRFSFTRMPLPFWFTATMTYLSVAWEVLFTPLVLWWRTRKWTLYFGILFHLGIFLTLEIGWFSFYSICFYAVWIPCSYWNRRSSGALPSPEKPLPPPEKTLFPGQ